MELQNPNLYIPNDSIKKFIKEIDTPGVNKNNYTHHNLFDPNLKLIISKSKYNIFWDSYCELIKNNTLNLSEKTTEIIPLIGNFSFKFKINENEKRKPYNDLLLKHICFTYQKAIKELFEYEDNEKIFNCVILQSEFIKDNGHLFSNVRFQFPYAKIDKITQNTIVRDYVIQELRNRNVLRYMEIQCIGDWDIISEPIKDEIVMYGSIENKNQKKLIFKKIWNFYDILNQDEENQVIEEVKTINSFEEIFNIEDHIHVIEKSFKYNKEKNKEFYLPLFLSINYWNQCLNKKEIIEEFNINDTESTNIIQNLLIMLNKERYYYLTNWLEIGKAIYSYYKGRNDGLLLWIESSKKNTENNIPEFMKKDSNIEFNCKALYYTFENSNITVNTIAWYAKEDNIEKYNEWHQHWCHESMDKSLNLTHTDIANALYKWYWLDFIYSKGKWYKFYDHRWHEDDEAIELKKIISDSFMNKYEKLRAFLSNEIADSKDEDMKKDYEKKIAILSKIIQNLKNVTFKKSIVKEASEKFNNSNFSQLLNANPDLTGVTNGIIDISSGKFKFRNSKPEDFISMSTNIPYQINFNWENKLVKECLEWIGKVFTNNNLKEHFLKFSASALKAKNTDKIFPIWTGEGDNSKSFIVKLFESTFNSYCIKFPVSMFNEKTTSSSNATPQLARAKSTRLVFIDEPEDDLPIHKGIIKRYTGGDSFFARHLNENGNEVKASFTMVLMCNKVPIIPNADKAIINRTKIFPFTSTWVSNPPEDIEEQYKQRLFLKDPSFEQKISTLAPAFLWILSQYWEKYIQEGLIDPDIVVNTTSNYWKDNDTYEQFINDNINKTDDKEYHLTLTELYTKFKLWFKYSFPTSKVPERILFRDQIIKKLGKPSKNNIWDGIIFIEE